MKLLFYDDYRLGVLKEGRVVDVTGTLPHVGILPPQAQIEGVIEQFASFRPRFQEIVAKESGIPLSDVKVRPPLPRPHNILCAFSNYQDRDRPPDQPPGALDFFYKGATGIIGHGDTVELQDIEEVNVFQPEPEFGYVIGKQAKHVTEASALDYVFGYLNFVDVSARLSASRRTTFLGKGQDAYAPIGPVITTADEVPDPQNVRVRLWLNGEQKQDYSTADMTYSVAAQIAWLTQYITLMPGDVLSCGTHHVGLSPINDGDLVEVEGDGLERLAFNVKSHGPRKTAHWAPPGVRQQ